MDFRYHLVKISSEFVYSYLVLCRDEYARSILFRNPAVLELVQCVVFRLFRLKGELIILFISVCINLVENNENRLVYGLYVLGT